MSEKRMIPYRPSNGSEGEAFRKQFCYRCVNDDFPNGDGCPILGATMAYGVDDPNYPKEWVMPEWSCGEPFPLPECRCTAFVPRNPPEEVALMAATLNLTDIYNKAHAATGGEKEVDIAQHNESCGALMDALADEKPSLVLATLEARKKAA